MDQSKKGAVAPAGMLHSLRSGPFFSVRAEHNGIRNRVRSHRLWLAAHIILSYPFCILEDHRGIRGRGDV